MNRRTLALTATLLVSLVACEKKEVPAPPVEAAAPVTTAAPPAAPSATVPAAPTVDVTTLPVEEQYEADAEKEVTAENLTAKLDELEKEIAEP